jgi:1,5-anhydro-D-fructose reductase (1,5-anhydro-D-mannitol-forming)
MAESTPVGWGLIGTSGFAARAAAPAVEEAAGAVLLAVLGSDPGKTREFAEAHGVAHACSDLDELLSVPGLEAVWVTSPPFLHCDQALAILAAGKHALVEKPLAISSEQGWSMVAAARDTGLVLATGYQARYVPAHLAMAAMIRDGEIGEVATARTLYAMNRPQPPQEWRRRRATAGWGTLADIGTHHIDLLRMLLGEITDAVGLSAHRTGNEVDDAYVAALRFQSGALASLMITAHAAQAQTLVEVQGTGAALTAINTSPDGQGPVTVRRPGEEPQELAVERPNSVVAEVETVSAAVRGASVLYATGEDGARNLEILERLRDG